MSNSPQRHGIFLCYRREDSEDFASRLYDELADRYGHPRVFKDVDSLLPGFDWEDHLRDRLAEAAIVIVIIGPDWSDCTDAGGRRRIEAPDDHVRTEIESSLAERIPVIPLLVGQAQLPERTTLPESIRALVRRQSFAIRRDQHFRPDVRLFIENLDRIFETLAARAAASPASPPPSGTTVATPDPAPPMAAPSPPAIATSPPSPPASPEVSENRDKTTVDAPGAGGKRTAFLWCGRWYLTSLLLPIPPLAAWGHAKLLRQRAPAVHGWWPVSSVSMAITIALWLTIAAFDDGYSSPARFFGYGLVMLIIFLPQWALLHVARVPRAWLWLVVPAFSYWVSGVSCSWTLPRSDSIAVFLAMWISQGMITGPLLYWLTRGQGEHNASPS